MNFNLTKASSIIKRTKKGFAKSVDTLEKSIKKRTIFLNRWGKVSAKFFRRIGRKIHDISPNWLRKIAAVIAAPFKYIVVRIRSFMKRRPHRSFRLTRRRDYVRSLKLPGYWAFTSRVFSLLWQNKKLFGLLVLLYTVLYAVVAGISAQQSYTNLSETLKMAGSDLFTGAWGQIGQAGLLLVTSLTTGLNPSPTQAEGILTAIIALMTWLTVVWLLRNIMAGHKVRLRDGIYSSGSPIMGTFIVGVVLMVQLLPIAVLILVYNAAMLTGLLEGGVEAMLFWVAAVLIVVGVLYWITNTIIALVIVTLPGMYPFQAISTAGDLVVGRRLRILLRILWALFLILMMWLIIAIPIIIFDSWFKTAVPNVAWIPLVPLVILSLSALSIVWLSSYVYVLYRKVVEDDAGPV